MSSRCSHNAIAPLTA